MGRVPSSDVDSMKKGFVLHLDAWSGGCEAEVDVVEVGDLLWCRDRCRRWRHQKRSMYKNPRVIKPCSIPSATLCTINQLTSKALTQPQNQLLLESPLRVIQRCSINIQERRQIILPSQQSGVKIHRYKRSLVHTTFVRMVQVVWCFGHNLGQCYHYGDHGDVVVFCIGVLGVAWCCLCLSVFVVLRVGFDGRIPLVLEEELGSSQDVSCYLGGRRSSTFLCFG